MDIVIALRVTGRLVDTLFGHEKSDEIDELVVVPQRVHIHPILPVHYDAWRAGNLHCSDLRVRGPDFHIYRERSSGRKECRGIYTCNTRIAASSVFERRLRGLESVGHRVADGELAGFPDGIEHRPMRPVRNTQDPCGKVSALKQDRKSVV